MSSTPTSNLVSGSVWERRFKDPAKSPTTSVVMFVTNDGLSPTLLEENPQQVVFVTESKKILSMSVEAFLNRRVYIGFSSDLAAALKTAVDSASVEEGEEGEETLVDISSIVPDPSMFVSAADQDQEDSDESDDQNLLSLNIGPHPTKAALESSLIGYTESPYHTGDTLHTLEFLLDGELSLEDIQKAFTSSDPNSVQKFELSTDYGTFQVDIDGVIGVMLKASNGFASGNLYITSAGDFRSSVNSPTVAVVTPVAPVAAPVVAPSVEIQQVQQAPVISVV